MKVVLALLSREFKTEWRNKYVIAGMGLYSFSSVLLVYFFLNYSGEEVKITAVFWAILFWLLVLFSSVNAIANSFFKEPEGRFQYLYYTVSSKEYVIGKFLFNLISSFFLGLITFAVFAIMIPVDIKLPALFVLVLLLGNMAYSFLFSLMSAISARAGSNSGLVAILGFPIVVPLLIFISRLSITSLQSEFIDENVIKNMIILISFNFILPALGIILFPYIWRD